MKRSIIILLLIAMVLIASPVAAARNAPVGNPISVFEGWPETYPANEAFHIKHGFWAETIDGRTRFQYLIVEDLKGFDFQLQVDGLFRDEDFVLPVIDYSQYPFRAGALWVHNFPEGMTGEVTFTGKWIAPCIKAVINGWYFGACLTPETPVIALEKSHTVEFAP